ALAVGVGFDPQNPFGMRWDDQYGFKLMRAGNAEARHTDYLSLNADYEKFLKNYYAGMWRQEPVYMMMHYVKKFLYCIAYILICLLGLFYFLLTSPGKISLRDSD